MSFFVSFWHVYVTTTGLCNALLAPAGNCHRKVVELTILQPNVTTKYLSLIKPAHL